MFGKVNPCPVVSKCLRYIFRSLLAPLKPFKTIKNDSKTRFSWKDRFFLGFFGFLTPLVPKKDREPLGPQGRIPGSASNATWPRPGAAARPWQRPVTGNAQQQATAGNWQRHNIRFPEKRRVQKTFLVTWHLLLGGWEIMVFWVFWWFVGGFWLKNHGY